MNALQNLTGVGGGGPGVMGIAPRPPGAPISGMGQMAQMQMGQHAMQGVPGGQQAGKINNLAVEPQGYVSMKCHLIQYLPQQALPDRCR